MESLIAFASATRLGLLLNFVGTVLVAVAFGKNLDDAYQEAQDGRRVYLASLLHPQAFRIGLALIAVGFVIQLLAEDTVCPALGRSRTSQ